MSLINYNLFEKEESDYHNNWRHLLEILNQTNEIITILNIGVGEHRENGDLACLVWNIMLKEEIHSTKKIINLEIDRVLYEKALNSSNNLINNVILGDVRNLKLYNEKIDLVFWSHGPEHIYRNEWKTTFSKLESIAKIGVILQMPAGKGYDYDVAHVSKNIQHGEIEKFNYVVEYDGEFDSLSCGILAYKFKNNYLEVVI